MYLTGFVFSSEQGKNNLHVFKDKIQSITEIGNESINSKPKQTSDFKFHICNSYFVPIVYYGDFK